MYVIVVIGNANSNDFDKLRFENMAIDVINELINKFSVKESDIRKLVHSSFKKIKNTLEEILIEKQKQDILLIYIGHGQENGWALSGIQDVDSLNYEELSLILARHEGKLIFLNCCCFA